MKPTDKQIQGFSRMKAEKRINDLLARMDTIHLYLTAATMTKVVQGDELFQPDYEVYVTAARTISEDLQDAPPRKTTEKDRRIAAVLAFLESVPDNQIADIVADIIHEFGDSLGKPRRSPHDEKNIMPFRKPPTP
jgi:hypothetical protein